MKGIKGLVLILWILLGSLSILTKEYFLAAITLFSTLYIAINWMRQRKGYWVESLLLFGLMMWFWEISTSLTEWVDPFLFPSPDKVLSQTIEDLYVIGMNILSSFKLLVIGFFLSLITAIPLGVYFGWNKTLLRIVQPLIHVASPIPPIVYIPYAVALLPSFYTSSVFVIYVGAFWPIFINTIQGVASIDQRLIQSARTLSVGGITFARRILLPGALPHILTGISVSLVFSFILLTAAEMIGASSGVGWYVKYFSDFGDYTRVVVGIITIGAMVSFIMFMMKKVETHLLRWRS